MAQVESTFHRPNPTRLNRLYPVFKSFLAGSFSATCSTLLFQPLDLVKTRIQMTPVAATGCSAGMVSVYKDVLRTEKVVGFWKGLTPSLLRTVPGVGLYFCTLNTLQSTVGSGNSRQFELIYLGAGARCLSGLIMLPATVVKTRFESGKFGYVGIMNALKTIYSAEGARGLYSGAVVTLVRDAPFSGLYLLFFTNTKKMVRSDGLLTGAEVFFSGVVAGIMASVITQPADVVKTHMQTKANVSLVSTLKHVYMMGGVSGFMSGIMPRSLRRTFMAALTWTLYEKALLQLGLK